MPGGKSKSSSESQQRDQRVLGDNGAIVVGAESENNEFNFLDGGVFDFAADTQKVALDFVKSALGAVTESSRAAQASSLAAVSAVDTANRDDSTLIAREIVRIGVPSALLATAAWWVFRK